MTFHRRKKATNLAAVVSASFFLALPLLCSRKRGGAFGFLASPPLRPFQHCNQFQRTARRSLLLAAVKEKKKKKETSRTTDKLRRKSSFPKDMIVNGEPQLQHQQSESSTSGEEQSDSYALAAEDLVELMEEINDRVVNGTASMLRNITEGIDEKLVRLPEQSADELVTYLGDLTAKVQSAQERELERQLMELDRRFRKPLEDLAFSDVPLLETRAKAKATADGQDVAGGNRTISDADQLILMGENSTLGDTRRMRTKDILRNWNVAPFYYSVALMLRWVRKASYPSIYPLSFYKWLASVIKSNSKAKGRVREVTGDNLEAGWKRTGEIAAKGSIARRWAVLRRSAEIWAYFSSFYLKDRRITSKYNSGRWSEEKFKQERSKLGKEITQNLLKLGPTFIKVGQLFSTRLDIVPKEYIDELKQLQDNVPGFSGETAIKIIESELGKPIDELFDEFDHNSLAAASLGQVHVARKGKTVMAIKIQRQFLRELFEVDLGQLRQVAIFADALDLQSEGGILDRNTQRDWVSVFEENKRLLYEEIDYINEMENAERFKKNFDSPKFRHIRIPDVYREYTTDKVLAMEYVPGIKVTDKEAILAEGLDPIEISVKMAESFLEQLCRHGFVSLATLRFFSSRRLFGNSNKHHSLLSETVSFRPPSRQRFC